MRKTAVITFLIVLIDQITKFFARQIPQGTIIGNNYIGLTHLTNTGSFFGILQGYNIGFVILSILVIALIIKERKRIKNTKEKIIAGLLLGGIIGNLIDRIIFGSVTDFIKIYIWPSFNIADSAITIGVILMIILILKEKD